MTALGKVLVARPESGCASTSFRVASRLAVLVLALASSYGILYHISSIWGPEGLFRIGIDPATAIVNSVDASGAAQGIRLGDHVDLAAMPFRERGYLYADTVYPVGVTITVHVAHNGRSRATTFRTIEATEVHTLENNILTWSGSIVAMAFVATGVILVWNRPSVMLWGLAVYLIRTHDLDIGPFPSPAIAALVIFAYAFICALGFPGLIVFAARFPDGCADKATKYWDIAAAGVFIHQMVTLTYGYIPLFTTRPIRALPDFEYVYAAISVVLFIVLCMRLHKRRCSRAGLAWIVAGFGVGIVIGRTLFGALELDSYWAAYVQLLFMFAMPASVAYSVIRHRAFNLGNFANRTLVYAVLVIVAASIFVIGDWRSSYDVSTTTTLGIDAAMFVALAIGMVLQAQRGRAVRFVDRIFLPQRYEVGVSLDCMREQLRGTNDPKRAAGEVAETLGLASVAVFERTLDGGFVRNAACGWPDGTAWHLLPGETLTHSLEGGATVIALPDELADDYALRAAHARPRVALTIRRGGCVERVVLVGPYRDGGRLDRDAIRTMYRIFDDALAV